MKRVLRVIAGVLASVGAVMGAAMGVRAVLSRARLGRAMDETEPTGLSEAVALPIGGVDQWVLLQAADVRHPVLLVLHGGPGLPIPGVAFRCVNHSPGPIPLSERLKRHTVLVYWDQRGSGKSYRRDLPAEELRFERLVEDTLELIDELRARFGADKLWLLGISWGGLIGVEAARRVPEKLHGYLGCGQMVNWGLAQEHARQWCIGKALESGDGKTARALEELGPAPYGEFGRWASLEALLSKCGAFSMPDPQGRKPSFGDAVMPIVTSPDYRLADLLALAPGLKKSAEALLEESAGIDLLRSAPKLEVPAHFFHGRHDAISDAGLLEMYAEALDAPEKSVTWLEESAHLFSREDAGRVEDAIIALVRPLA